MYFIVHAAFVRIKLTMMMMIMVITHSARNLGFYRAACNADAVL